MNRELVWTALRWPGCEHLDLRAGADGVSADGLVLAVVDDRPVRVRYQVVCDAGWRTRQVRVEAFGQPPVLLARDGDRWRDHDGAERPELAGCVDVDIALTPFTNTLPIRRLRLEPGESADLRVLYVQPVPGVTIGISEQRYLRLPPGGDAHYRYESGSFRADLRVDGDGIVTDYPGLWLLRHG